MPMEEKKIRSALIDGGYITEKELTEAATVASTRRMSLVEYLLTQEIVTKDILGQALAESFKVPYANLHANLPTQEQVMKIPEAIARKFRVVFFVEKKTGIIIATDDPSQTGIADAVKEVVGGKKVTIAYALTADIDLCFRMYRKVLESQFAKIIEAGTRIAPELLNAIFADAFATHASDIHFEPEVQDVLVRFRIDGVLRDAGRLPKLHYDSVLNLIKVQSNIRLDEHRAAQDGALQFTQDMRLVDVRTSIVPTVEGEKIVLRVLNSYVEGLSLSELGLAPEYQKMLEESANKPFGMILVAGPTGSGKTTTLYALLKGLNQADVNITTIEDPVEYKMQGVNQIQVNTNSNLTFAQGLRAIVRQDPDIILVGEIRDRETAEIAVNAALTGHLLLSTFHANDAATAIPRLMDMGIEPFLLASTFELAIAQRLVRKICDQCRFSVAKTAAQLLKESPEIVPFVPVKKSITLYQGKGCEACGHSGYRGRTAIFEVIRMTAEMQDFILKNPSSQEVWKLARSQGAKTLFEDGVTKLLSGVTTLEELLRVAQPPKEKSV